MPYSRHHQVAPAEEKEPPFVFQHAFELKNVSELVQMLKLPVSVCMFRRDGCHFCISFKPTFDRVAGENTEINSYVCEESLIQEYAQTNKQNSFIETIEGYPTTFLFQSGRSRAEEIGNLSASDASAIFFKASKMRGHIPSCFAVSAEDAARFARGGKQILRAKEPHDKVAQNAISKSCVIILSDA